MQQVLTEAARLIKRLENMERRKRCCFQVFMKVLFPMTESRLYSPLLSIRETSSGTYGLVEEWRERTSRRQLSVEKEGSRAKIWEKLGENAHETNPRVAVAVGGRPTRRWWSERRESSLWRTSVFVQEINNPAHNVQLYQNALSLCSSRQKQQDSNSVLGILSSKSQPEYLQQSIRLCLGDPGVGFILAGVLGSTQKQLLQTGHLDTAVEITI